MIDRGSRLKLERAAVHIGEFERELAAYRATRPFRVKWLNAKRTAYDWELVNYPPIALGLICGDAVHCMRAALDLLAWQLARSSSGGDLGSERQWSFPFAESQVVSDQLLSTRLPGLSEPVVGAIRAAHPYPAGNDLLWALHKLDIWDKHQLIVPLAGEVNGMTLTAFHQESLKFEVRLVTLAEAQALYPELDITALPAASGGFATSEAYLADPSDSLIEICFGPGTPLAGRPMLPGLRAMHAEVGTVIDRVSAVVESLAV